MRKLALLTVGASSLLAGLAFFAGCGSSDGDAPSPGLDGGTTPADGGAAEDSTAPSPTFAVVATVVGLEGSGLVLRDASGAETRVAPKGGATQKVTMPMKLASGEGYDVSVKTQPSGPTQRCLVAGGKGTIASGDATSVTVNCTTKYTVGGTVSGLSGKNLVLENNAGDAVTVNANGQFAFATPLDDGAAFAVTVKANPTEPWQTCTVARGDAGASGTIAAADVTDVAVACTTNEYALSVKVTGLVGSGLVFQNKGASDLAVAADGTHPFAGAIASGTEYDVTVLTQPSSPPQTCTVTAPKARIAGAPVVLDVACATNKYKVGGTLVGLQGNGLVLQNNGGGDLTLNAAANGAFSFAASVEYGQPYSLTVKTAPAGIAGEDCKVVPDTSSGTMGAADVTSVIVTCATSRKAFVSSALYTGDMGGIAGADEKCQALATAAALPGVFRAWLSTTTSSPSLRFTRSAAPYTLVDGTKIADDWTDLTDGSLDAVLDKTESGGAAPQGTVGCPAGNPTVWTGTSTNGTLSHATVTCSDWTSTGGSSLWGRTTASDGSWTSWCSGGTCAWTAPIYCYQQ